MTFLADSQNSWGFSEPVSFLGLCWVAGQAGLSPSRTGLNPSAVGTLLFPVVSWDRGAAPWGLRLGGFIFSWALALVPLGFHLAQAADQGRLGLLSSTAAEFDRCLPGAALCGEVGGGGDSGSQGVLGGQSGAAASGGRHGSQLERGGPGG